MNAVRAIWKNGNIVLVGPVDWPEGCEVSIEPVQKDCDRIGVDEADWRDEPESRDDWNTWISTLTPLEFTSEEERRIAEFDAEMRRYNVEMMRRQIEEAPR
ncbi:MAG: hypothetical protein NT069_33275 [Planctomycetota bacterium]|nr:hypothetical protein [Planctomycetota bacterium]